MVKKLKLKPTGKRLAEFKGKLNTVALVHGQKAMNGVMAVEHVAPHLLHKRNPFGVNHG